MPHRASTGRPAVNEFAKQRDDVMLTSLSGVGKVRFERLDLQALHGNWKIITG